MKTQGNRGWVAVSPDGLVMWTGASWHRRATQEWVVRCFGDPMSDDWKHMYEKGWRTQRCCLER